MDRDERQEHDTKHDAKSQEIEQCIQMPLWVLRDLALFSENIRDDLRERIGVYAGARAEIALMEVEDWVWSEVSKWNALGSKGERGSTDE